MKIAIINGLWIDVPPSGYGGTQRIIYELVENLVKKGHEITLFASGTSKTSAKLVSVYPRALAADRYPWTDVSYPLLNITEAIDRQKDFDILHFHLDKQSDLLALPLAERIKNKVLFTLHFPYPLGYSKNEQRTDRHEVFQKYKELNYTSISNTARKGGENLNWIATVYNGIDLSDYTFVEHPEKYFLWLGKFNPTKGTKEAILAAKKADVQLVLAGKIDETDEVDRNYYYEEIKPLIDAKQIKYVGEVDGKNKDELYGKAHAFLNPIQWNEPFGLVMVESQATGTPVISFNSGAAPELILDNQTGYLVNSVDQMVEKIKDIDKLNRLDCRKHIEQHFSSQKMVESYEKVYEKLL